MKHEIGHNQGAHHDRQTVVGGSNGAYNYGYRRCSNGNAPSGLNALASNPGWSCSRTVVDLPGHGHFRPIPACWSGCRV